MENTSALQDKLNFEHLFQALPGQYIILSPELEVLAVSDAYLKATHSSRAMLVGRHIMDVFPDTAAPGTRKPEESPEYSMLYALKYKKDHSSPAVRYDIHHPEGGGHIEQHYWHLTSKPILNETGEVAYIIHEARDITEQYLMEQQAKSAQESLQRMAKVAGGAVWEYDVPRNKLIWSESYKDLFGYKDSSLEVDPTTWDELVHPNDLPLIRHNIDVAVRSKAKTWMGEYRYRKADGTYADVIDHGYILYDSLKMPMRMFGTMVDVTWQKDYERELQESQKRFELVAMTTNDVIWDWNLLDDTIWWNEGFKTLFGYKEEDIEPTVISWTGRLHPDDMQRVKGSIYQVINGGDTSWECEYQFRCADGSYKIVHDSGHVIHNNEGTPVRMLGAMRDITENRKYELQLEDNLAMARQILESLPHLAWTATPDGAVNYYNQNWYDYTGLSFAELGAWGWAKSIHPDDYPATLKLWEEAIATGKDYMAENRWRSMSTGKYRWFLARSLPIRDSNGHLTMWVGTLTDIEDHKQAQLALQESKDKFRFLAESIPQMVWSANPDGHIDYTNHRWYEYSKMDEESLGFGWAPAIHPNERQLLIDTWMRCVQTGEKLEMEVRFQDTEAKTYRWFLLLAEPMYGNGGEIMKWFGTATDIHEQKLLREQLEESEKQFRFLAESIPQMVWTTRPDGYHDYFNQRWMDYTGLTMEESMGMVWSKLVHPDDRERSKTRWLHSLETGVFYEVEYRFRNGHDGTYRWFLGQAIPMRDSEGNIVKWFGTCTDIEDHKKAEEELVEKNLELERINQDLDSFVYTASHDLKLPIINMAGIFEELIQSADFKDPDAPKMVAMFNKSLEQIHGTIHDLGEVVKVQKAKSKEQELVNLEELTENVKLSIQDMLKHSNATIITNFEAAPELAFSRSSLRSIFYNLISNAIKYRSHERQPEIHLSTEVKGDFVELKVQDNGLGIDMNKHQSKLFQMFKRFHNHVNGSGLGLYIVNRLITNNGGYINIESTLNEGTTFYLYFKKKKV
ncbi:PAS domain-containing protein [Pontibacter sp. SGAir0037]|uniref:PAS domain-containing protein n=1 Tax=Pontibacter sp. SGAir0037 TaxID=2571030 RepID=UPI0010CCDBBE|nr:PAS domain-containing protein [Pontibacter sp. SGAir0037]QCR23738.1 hypothetical protein C1N53_16220 [Pontibacter sp. SGAir0037]